MNNNVKNLWILNFIRNSQLVFPEISKTPFDVMRHLLLTNGNGHEIRDGNFYVIKYGYNEKTDEYYEKERISYEEYYSDDTSFKEKLPYFLSDEYYESYEKELGSGGLKEFMEKREPGSFKRKYLTRFDDVIPIDDFSLEELHNKDTWIDFIRQSEYEPFIQISDKYYKLYFFNENTDKDLIKISIPFLEGLVEYLEELEKVPEETLMKCDPKYFNSEEFPKGRKKLGCEYKYYKTVFEAISKLKKDIKRLKKLL